MPKYENTAERIRSLATASTILKSTCQLFLCSYGEIKPHGCAVLFSCNSKFYCLSNSHVLNKIKYPEIFFLHNRIKPFLLEGGIMFSERNLTASNDTFDVGIMELAPHVVEKIKDNHTFLVIDKIEYSVSMLENNVTMIAAYPEENTNFNSETNVLDFNPLIVRTVPFVKDCSSLGFPKLYHHVVKYPKKSFIETSTKETFIAPFPHGMSGSGLWLLTDENEFDYKPVLIGILSEYRHSRSLIFATKIDLFLSIIQQLFDSTLPYSGMNVQLDIIQ
jgi:hypothetical protein